MINIRLLYHDKGLIPCISANSYFLSDPLSNFGCTAVYCISLSMVYPIWVRIYKWLSWFKWKIDPIGKGRLRFRHLLCCVTPHSLSGIIYSGNLCCREYQWMFSVNLSMKILWSSCPRKPTIVSVYCIQLVWSICSFILCRKQCTWEGGGIKNAMDGSRVRQSSCLHFIFVVLLTKNDLFSPSCVTKTTVIYFHYHILSLP